MTAAELFDEAGLAVQAALDAGAGYADARVVIAKTETINVQYQNLDQPAAKLEEDDSWNRERQASPRPAMNRTAKDPIHSHVPD